MGTNEREVICHTTENERELLIAGIIAELDTAAMETLRRIYMILIRKRQQA